MIPLSFIKEAVSLAPILLVLLSVADILLYTVRSYTNKLFAISFEGKPSMATPVFSAITGFAGFVLTMLLSGGLQIPSLTTLLCGIGAGLILFLYDLGNIRAANTGPYAIQSIICMFGCVMLPLLFERVLWNVSLSAQQLFGIGTILVSFVYLNMNSKNATGIKKGYFGWVALLFFANGLYSTVMVAQQRWTHYAERNEMIATVFLTLCIVSLLYLILGCKVRLSKAFRLKGSSWGFALTSSFALTGAMSLLVILL